MSDFQSSLRNFQNALGTTTASTKAKDSTSSSRRRINENPSRGTNTKSSLKDKLTNLWRQSQIKRALAIDSGQKIKSKATSEHDENSSSQSHIHVAICATIVSTLPHEPIWKSWLDHKKTSATTGNGTNACTASMHIHAKSPSAIRNDSWLKSKLIPISHNPDWNDIRIVKAMLSLIEFALKDDRTTHIMFVTESCIPIASLDELASLLREKWQSCQSGCSFLDAYTMDSPRCTRFDEHECFNIKDVPNEAIHKALPGWCLLSKEHAQLIMDLPKRFGEDVTPLFKNVWAPEEVFFPTMLSLLGKLPGKEVVQTSIMWAKWDETARGKQRAHPLQYDGKFSAALVNDARREGCLFMRKYKYPLDLQHWERVVFVEDNTSVGVKRSREEDRDGGKQKPMKQSKISV